MAGIAGATGRGRPTADEESDTSEAGRRRVLRRSALFGAARTSSLDELARRSRVEHRSRGRILFQQGQTPDHVHVIAQGRVRLARQSREGKEYLVCYRDAGDIIGEPLICGAPAHREAAEAVEAVALIAIPTKTVRKVVDSDAGVAGRLLQAVALRRFEVEDYVERILFRSVESRLAELILELASSSGRPDPRGALIAAKLTHAEVSRTVGSTRETVTLTLGAFRRRGLIDFDRRRIVVRDPQRLRSLV